MSVQCLNETGPVACKPPADQSTPAARSSIVYLDVFRIVAILAVICTHVSDRYGLMRLPNITPEDWIIGLTFFSATRFAVPAFLMISGALVLTPERRETIGQCYRHRLPRVLIPLLGWKLVYYFDLVYPAGFSLAAMANFVVTNNYIFWFMYLIACLYLAVPFLNQMIRAGGDRLIVPYCALAFALYTLSACFRSFTSVKIAFFNYIGFFSVYVAYFLLGYWIRRHWRPLNSGRVARLFGAGIVASILLSVVGTWYLTRARGTLVNFFLDIQLPPVAVVTVGLFVILRHLFPEGWGSPGRQRLLRAIGGCGLGIYLLHPLLLIYVNRILSAQWPGSILHPLISIPLAVTVTYAASLLAMLVIRRIPILRHLSC